MCTEKESAAEIESLKAELERIKGEIKDVAGVVHDLTKLLMDNRTEPALIAHRGKWKKVLERLAVIIKQEELGVNDNETDS